MDDEGLEAKLTRFTALTLILDSPLSPLSLKRRAFREMVAIAGLGLSKEEADYIEEATFLKEEEDRPDRARAVPAQEEPEAEAWKR